jgi:FixJ family two-component response regulator
LGKVGAAGFRRLNKQIAADLNINERTVKLHRTAITTKPEVRSVAQLTRQMRAQATGRAAAARQRNS